MAGTGAAAGTRPDGRLGLVAGVLRQSDYWITVYKRTWKASIVSSFVSPLFYVLAMGVLLGGFVRVSPARLEGAHSYLDFIVPGLIAAQAMQTAVFECSYPVLGGIKWHKSFFAQLATPLAPRDLADAMLAFVLFRVGTTCGVFFLVMTPFGVFATWWGPPLAWLVTMLVGMTFAPWVFALAAHTVSESVLSLVFRLGMIPLFLFSGSFFPIANLGHTGAFLARLTPLWHGVDLARMLCLGRVDVGTAVVHVVVLTGLGFVGWLVAVRVLTRRLQT